MAALCAGTVGAPRIQRILGLAGSALLLAASLAIAAKVYPDNVMVARGGNWPAPFGIVLVADGRSATMVLLTGIMAFLIAIFSSVTIAAGRLRDGFFFLYFALLAGVNGAFLTGDLFNLYVWFEVLLIASFVLIVLGGRRGQLDGAVKYVTMNLLGSVIFLSAVGLIYGKTGTLNLADLAQRMAAFTDEPMTSAACGMLLVAFGIKAGAFPLFSWLPASYHTPPHAVTILFSALLTKVGVYSVIRIMTLVFAGEQAHFQPMLLVIASLTMVTGVLGAVAQYDVRRLLSFHIVSQIGYLLFGLALFSTAGLAASIFFMVHVMAAKAALFVAAAIAAYYRGTSDLLRLGNLAQAHPALAVLFAVPAMSLAGLPPFSGFIGKLALVRAGLDGGAFVTVGVSLGVSILTLYSMTKIWNEAFWKPAPPGHREFRLAPAQVWGMAAPGMALAFFSVGLAAGAEPAFRLSLVIAAQLLDPSVYIGAVLGGGS